MSAIFLSYRRDDTSPYARLIAGRLGAKFGKGVVFMDIDSIKPGADFVNDIVETLGKCSVVLVLIGKGWNPPQGDGPARRLDDPKDFVRQEVGLALARNNLQVIPILVGGAKMPSPSQLPAQLAGLARRQAIELSDDRGFDQDVDRLIESIEPSVQRPATAAPPSQPALQPEPRPPAKTAEPTKSGGAQPSQPARVERNPHVQSVGPRSDSKTQQFLEAHGQVEQSSPLEHILDFFRYNPAGVYFKWILVGLAVVVLLILVLGEPKKKTISQEFEEAARREALRSATSTSPSRGTTKFAPDVNNLPPQK